MRIGTLRRRWIAAFMAVITLGALASCGAPAAAPSSTPSAPAASPASSRLPAAEGTTTYPLTLDSAWGKTTLQKRPERIAIATAANDLDNTLALGVTPVWADDWQASYEWTTTAGSKKIERRGEVTDSIPVEDIAASKPDLIIAVQTGAGIIEDAYPKLATIAPVLTVEKPSWDITWQETVRLIGKTLDLSKRAELVISDVDAKVDEAAQAHPEFRGKSLAFVLWLQGNEKLTFRSFQGSPTSELFAKLGFAEAPSASKFSRENLVLSAENYALMDADVVLIASPKTQFDKLLKTPTFATVPAIAQKRYALIDLSVEKELGWAVSWPSALSVPWFLDKIVPPLSSTLG